MIHMTAGDVFLWLLIIALFVAYIRLWVLEVKAWRYPADEEGDGDTDT